MGVVNLNIDTLVQIQVPYEGWADNDSLTEHLLGVILVQQYNLSRGCLSPVSKQFQPLLEVVLLI